MIKLINDQANKDALLEQYRLYLSSASEISDRRQKANEYYLTVNTILVSFIVFVSQYDKISDPKMIIYFITLIGLINSVITYFIIRSYKQLNSVKFKVIHELEKLLPANLFAYEWELLGKGKIRSKYWPFSHLELKIPLLFAIVYIGLAIFIAFNK